MEAAIHLKKSGVTYKQIIPQPNFIFLLFQVIALSKQQGLLHSPRSEDGGSIRYRALTDQDPSPPASTTGALGGLYTYKLQVIHRFLMGGAILISVKNVP